MSTFTAILAMVISVTAGLAIHARVKDLWAKWWWSVISATIGIVGGYCLLGQIHSWLERLLSGSFTMSYVYGVICAVAIMAGAVIGVAAHANRLLKPSLGTRFLVWLFAVIIGGGAGFKALGLVVSPIEYVQIIGSLVGVMSLIFVAYYWQRGIQDGTALYVGYIATIVMGATLSWAVVGINPFENLKGSISTIIPFVIFNTGLVVLVWILGRKKPFREMIGYKIIYLLVCIMIIFTTVTTILQLTGYINKYEHQALRVANKARWHSDSFQRRKHLKATVDGEKYFAAQKELAEAHEAKDASKIDEAKSSLEGAMREGKTFLQAQSDFDAAIQSGDEVAMKSAKASIEAHLDLQKKYEDERMEMDDGYLAPWKGAMGLVERWKTSSKKSTRRTTEERMVTFLPEQGSWTGLQVKRGDSVFYINPSAPFKIIGSSGKYHLVKKTEEHEAKGDGELVIDGYKEGGTVLVRVVPR